MKSLPLASLALVASLSLTSCVTQSGEVSEIEKRNKFDACVLDFMADSKNQSVSSWKFDREKFRQAGEISCRHILRAP